MSTPRYRILVFDNFQFMRNDDMYEQGTYTTLAEAVAECQRIVDEELRGLCDQRPDAGEGEIYDFYVIFGNTPVVVAVDQNDERVDFSARDYAKGRIPALMNR
jgi:hypothetical protein